MAMRRGVRREPPARWKSRAAAAAALGTLCFALVLLNYTIVSSSRRLYEEARAERAFRRLAREPVPPGASRPQTQDPPRAVATGVRGTVLERLQRLQEAQDAALSEQSAPSTVGNDASSASTTLAPAAADARAAPAPRSPRAAATRPDGLWTEYVRISAELDALVDEARREAPNEFANAYVFEEQARQLSALARTPGVRQICEVGFNCGHSSAAWLLFAPPPAAETKVLSFDVFRQRYAERCRRHVQSVHAGRDDAWSERIEFVRGDSADTLPEAAYRRPDVICDLTMVDGLHVGAQPTLDLMASLSMSTAGSIVVMDDARCSSWWCADVTRAWEWAIEAGKVRELSCHEYEGTRAGPSVGPADEAAGPAGRFDASVGTRGWCVGEVVGPLEVCPPGVPRERDGACGFRLPGAEQTFRRRADVRSGPGWAEAPGGGLKYVGVEGYKTDPRWTGRVRSLTLS